jgi:hypothetical protein
MTRARRLAAVAFVAGVAAGLAGLAGPLGGALGPNRVSVRPSSVTRLAQPGAGSGNQAGSAVPTLGAQSARIASAEDLLAARTVAVLGHNKPAWMATVDVPGSSFGVRQSVEFDNLVKLPLGQFSYGSMLEGPALAGARARQAGPEAWVATVSGSYVLTGYDRAPRTFEATYTLVQRPGGWRIADDSAGPTGDQVWDLPGLRVLTGRSVLVVGNAPEGPMRGYEAIADSAVQRVDAVWGSDWNAHVVLVTPSTNDEFAALLGRPADGSLDQVAALTQGDIDPGQRAQGDRVIINPKAFTALQHAGRQVVITHELTHVAARSSTTRPVPTWLSEGMADYVGYSGLNLPRQRVASDLLALVRQGKGPKVLPTAADFDPERTKIAPTYSASWLAVSRLVDLYGQARVVSFYRAIAGGMTIDQRVPFDPDAVAAQAFPRVFGVTEARFVEEWTRYLQILSQTRG